MAILKLLAASCKELTHWKRLWCWEGLEAGGEGDHRKWDGWMASPTRWTWVWVNSGSWWWTGRPGVLQFMGSQRVGHDWATELNWTELKQKRLRRGGKNTQKNYSRKVLMTWINNSVVPHLELDILEYEGKRALGNITINKASGGERILAELFQVLKDNAVKVLHSICQQIRKMQQCP